MSGPKEWRVTRNEGDTGSKNAQRLLTYRVSGSFTHILLQYPPDYSDIPVEGIPGYIPVDGAVKIILLLTIIMTGIASAYAEDVKVYDKNWNVQQRVKK